MRCCRPPFGKSGILRIFFKYYQLICQAHHDAWRLLWFVTLHCQLQIWLRWNSNGGLSLDRDLHTFNMFISLSVLMLDNIPQNLGLSWKCVIPVRAGLTREVGTCVYWVFFNYCLKCRHNGFVRVQQLCSIVTFLWKWTEWRGVLKSQWAAIINSTIAANIDIWIGYVQAEILQYR